MIRILASWLTGVLLLHSPASAVAATAAPPSHAPPAPLAASPLANYVASPDADFRWEVVERGRHLGTDFLLIDLTSQRWHDIPWRHQLWLIDPTDGRGGRHALLFIGSGRWPAEGEPSREPPRSSVHFIALARALDTPVAVLRHVPFQPLFDGLTEDALIAMTFERFLEAPEETDWPLLLPMVNSAVRAMDALQALSREWAAPIETFTLAGASKRGWTTWLTAAVDPRVAALAPMVFDILNMEPQLEHQREVWGAPSEQIADYTERDIDIRLASEAGRRLQVLVDPYHYRESLTQPKLLVLASNDAYWPVDALNLYWDALPEPRYLLYLPNQGHSARDYGRLLPTLTRFHQAVARGEGLPTLDWHYRCEVDRVTLEVTTLPNASRAQAWVARAPTRDFRQARWEPVPMESNGDTHRLSLPRPEAGYLALFGELNFDALTLSTQVQVASAAPVEAASGCGN